MSSLPSIVDCGDPVSLLERCGPWLQREEARYNLMLGLASARAEAGSWEEGAAFLSVEADGEVAGCVMRTPPHKLLITDMPMSAVEPLVEAVLLRYPTIPPRSSVPDPSPRRSPARGSDIGVGDGGSACDRVSTS